MPPPPQLAAVVARRPAHRADRRGLLAAFFMVITRGSKDGAAPIRAAFRANVASSATRSRQRCPIDLEKAQKE
jgi:hypothetical protein